MKRSLFFLAAAAILLASCNSKDSVKSTENNFMSLATDRYACRSYTDRKVSDEMLQTILKAGQIAPTAANCQPQRIYVLSSPEVIEKISPVASTCGAPQAFLVCYDATKCLINGANGNHPQGEMDATIVLTHMMLQATELGLDTCWMTWIEFDRIKEILNLPENIVPVAFMPFGYAKEGTVPGDSHYKRLPIEETVTIL